MRPPQRVIITSCPHNGRHNGIRGYVVDTYPDGTASVDMGHNVCCITGGYEAIEPVKREALALGDDGLASDEPPYIAPPRRRGRPPKQRDSAPAISPPIKQTAAQTKPEDRRPSGLDVTFSRDEFALRYRYDDASEVVRKTMGRVQTQIVELLLSLSK